MSTANEQLNQLTALLPDAYIEVGRTLKRSQRCEERLKRLPKTVIQLPTGYEQQVDSLKAAQQAMKAANVFNAAEHDSVEHIDTWLGLLGHMQQHMHTLNEMLASTEHALDRYRQQQLDVGYAQAVADTERYRYAIATAAYYQQQPCDDEALMQPIYRFIEIVTPDIQTLHQEITIENARERIERCAQLFTELQAFEQADSDIRTAIRQQQQSHVKQLLLDIEQSIIEQLAYPQQPDSSRIKYLLDISYRAQHLAAPVDDCYGGISSARLIIRLEQILESLSK